MKFRTTVELGGKTATGIRVPEETVEALGRGKRPPVTVTINGYTYRSTVAAYNDGYYLPVSAEVRDRSGVAAGDEITVTVELDTAPREVEVPDDIIAALAGNPAAKARFDALSYSNKRRIVLQVEGAKAEDTRRRRIDKNVTDLAEGRI